jgi:hypothetical protein
MLDPMREFNASPDSQMPENSQMPEVQVGAPGMRRLRSRACRNNRALVVPEVVNAASGTVRVSASGRSHLCRLQLHVPAPAGFPDRPVLHLAWPVRSESFQGSANLTFRKTFLIRFKPPELSLHRSLAVTTPRKLLLRLEQAILVL